MWCLSWFLLGLLVHFSLWFFRLGKCQRHEHCLDYTYSYFSKQEGGQHMIAQSRVNVHEMMGRENKCKLNFFSMHFIWNLDDSVISLPVFPSRTNLKLHKIFITPQMVKKVITNLDSSKMSGPDCIPVMVQKNYEPELSYILAELFNKESCFPDCWKVSLVVRPFQEIFNVCVAKRTRKYC